MTLVTELSKERSKMKDSQGYQFLTGVLFDLDLHQFGKLGVRERQCGQHFKTAGRDTSLHS